MTKQILTLVFTLLIGYTYSFAADNLSPKAAPTMQVIASGDKSLSLNEQLSGVAPPPKALPISTPKVQTINYTATTGNEPEIRKLQMDIVNAFHNADKEADDFTKPEQYTLYMLYKQAEQNQLQLKQNDQMILALKEIAAQNDRLITLMDELKSEKTQQNNQQK